MNEKKRYIVEAHDYVQMISLIGVRNGNAIMITAPTDKFVTVDGELEKAYQHGLEDMHKAIQKISNMSAEEKEAVFYGQTLYYAINEYTTNGIMEKLAAYEKQQKADEIKVGDEVKNTLGLMNNAVGYFIEPTNNEYYRVLRHVDGKIDIVAWHMENCVKTGKHSDAVVQLLKAMKGEQRDCHTCKHQVASSIECVDCRGFGKWEPKEGAE